MAAIQNLFYTISMIKALSTTIVFKRQMVLKTSGARLELIGILSLHHMENVEMTVPKVN